MSKTFRDWNPRQNYLFPPSLSDFVPEDHVCHFILTLVNEELDIREILESYVEERGYPPHSPKMMTVLLLYGYMKGVYSSRKLSQACRERTDFMYVSGMCRPDHRPIASFRKRHMAALEGIFKQVVQLCAEAGLIQMKHVAIDGTKIRANASSSKNMSYSDLKKSEERLVSEWFEQAEAADREEDARYGEDKRGDEFPRAAEALERVRKAKKTLEERDRKSREERKKAEQEEGKPKSKTKERTEPPEDKQYNFTDPDSGLMRSRQGFIQGYNSQIAVDAESQIIVACSVSQAKNDLEELIPVVQEIKDNVSRFPEEVSADSGYCSTENLTKLKQKGIRGYIPKTDKIANVGIIREMSQRLKKGGRRSRYRIRKYTVEPVFGIIKSARSYSGFLMRGIDSVKTEWALVCSAHNLWKLAKARS